MAATEREALQLERELEAMIIPEYGVHQLSNILGVDLSDHPLDARLPGGGPRRPTASSPGRAIVTDLAEREQLTLRQLIGRLAGGRGHRVVTGTPEQIADQIEEWFVNGAADGFNIMPPLLPMMLEVFASEVVPILQRRGRFRRDYRESAYREHSSPPSASRLRAPRTIRFSRILPPCFSARVASHFKRLTGQEPDQYLIAGRGDGSCGLTTRRDCSKVVGQHRAQPDQVRHTLVASREGGAELPADWEFQSGSTLAWTFEDRKHGWLTQHRGRRRH